MLHALTRRGLLGKAIVAGVAALGVAASASAQSEAAPRASALKIGDKAPDFKLTDLDGNTVELKTYLDKGHTVVLEWFNPECPFVKKHHEHNSTMRDTYAAFKDQKVTWLAINSGAPGKQGASKDVNIAAVRDNEIKYPVLLDSDGKVGRAYGAKTTPHMFVIKSDGTLAYMGAIDNDNSPKKVGDKNYVKLALTSVLAGETVETTESKPYGCSVKY